MGDIVVTIAVIIAVILPLILTFLNYMNLCGAKLYPNIVDGLIMTLGPVLSFLLFGMWGPKDYQEPLHIPGDFEWHTPLASWHIPTIIVLVIVGLVGYGVIRIYKTKLSPLKIVICISCMLINVILGVVWIIQLSPYLFEPEIFYMFLFPFNYVICFINVTKEVIKNYTDDEQEKEYKNPIIAKCALVLRKSRHWPILALIMMIPILSITLLVLVIFGQQPTAAIKAFTETSDWMLSQKISPPPIEVDAHYLCTVSLRGHSFIVRPLRYGIRCEQKIVVNRQLCVANAFEQLLQQRVPVTHRFIRHIYDKYGYPLSKHITTPLSADIVYILMKPLEWLFLFVLYLFDEKPEDRIAMQYLPISYNLKDNWGR